MRRRVVITGMGLVTALGAGVEKNWNRLVAGEKRRQRIDLFETDGCRCREGAQVERLNEISDEVIGARKKPRHVSRALRLAAIALHEALKQARLEEPLVSEAPFVLSTTGGAMEWGEAFLRGVLTGRRNGILRHAARYQPQHQAMELAEMFDLWGERMIVGNACASGANAVGHGFDWIRSGAADRVVVGGVEALTELIFVGFDCLQSLSVTECKPFDVERDGLMLGEGAGFLVLEAFDEALARGAEVLGELIGYGHSTDGFHLTQPQPSGQALVAAMREAIECGGVSVEDVGYVNSHGTGTAMNDGAELAAYREVFGDAFNKVRFSSTKAAIGHTLGAAGAIEGIFAILAGIKRTLPPQVNTTKPIEGAEIGLVRLGQRLREGSLTMSVNLGFGGSNAALIFKT